MYSYSYFTAPTNDNARPFCQKCTSSYGCVCDLLVYHGHCPTCMNSSAKCICKEFEPCRAPTGTPSVKGSVAGKYASLSWTPGPQRMDPVAQQAKEMLELLQKTQYFTNALSITPTVTASPSWTEPAVNKKSPSQDRAKWQMNYFWKEACKAENVHFTRKEHCAYPRVLATYHRLRKEYDEQGEKLVRELSSGW